MFSVTEEEKEELKKQIENEFQIWWHEEGKFQVPPTKDYDAVKELVRTAWYNSAYVTKRKINV